MSYENDPHHPERDGQDQHATKPPSDPSGPGSPSAFEDPHGKSLQPRGGQYPGPDQSPLTGLDAVSETTLVGFTGPIPPPYIIEEYNRIAPGSGTRILNDAHDDSVEDRRITREAFEHTKRDAWLRLWIAAAVLFFCLLGIIACLAIFDPPESIAGATLFSLGAVASVVKEILNGPGSQESRRDEIR